jgi:hypothetical protein
VSTHFLIGRAGQERRQVRAIVVHQWAVSGGCRLSGSMIM